MVYQYVQTLSLTWWIKHTFNTEHGQWHTQLSTVMSCLLCFICFISSRLFQIWCHIRALKL